MFIFVNNQDLQHSYVCVNAEGMRACVCVCVR